MDALRSLLTATLTEFASLRGSFLLAALLSAGTCLAQPVVHLSKSFGPPTARLSVSGKGFSGNELLTVYFDEGKVGQATTDDSGAFADVVIRVPGDALPGNHPVRVVELDGTEWQAAFDVETSWQNHGFSNDGHRNNSVENILNRNNVGLVTKHFTFSTFHSDAFTPPAVSHGLVYVGSTDHRVYALDALTGHLVWKFVTRSEVIVSGAAVYHGVVYIGSEDGIVYALDARTGHLKWKYVTVFESSIWSSPMVADDVVYIAGGDRGKTLYALDAARGKPIWTFTAGDLISCAAAVVNGVVYFTSYDHLAYAVNAVDGALLWKFDMGEGTLFVSPAVVDGVVYVGGIGFHALDAKTGALIWENDSVPIGDTSPAVADGMVYVTNALGTYALNGKTGRVEWSNLVATSFSSPAIANGVVYVQSDNMYALDAQTGAALWKSEVSATDDFSSPTVANGVIYFSDGHTLYAFGLPGHNRQK